MSQITHKSLHDPILVAGLQVRTSNAKELSGTGQIATLWQRFFTESIDTQIPRRTSADIYAVYSNYASDEYGEYDYLIGAAVSSVENLPAGMTFAAIATGDYAVVTSEKGPVATVVQGTWREIWNMQPEELSGKRAFLTDYEIYDDRARDPESAQVEIHLGLDPKVEA